MYGDELERYNVIISANPTYQRTNLSVNAKPINPATLRYNTKIHPVENKFHH
uniref:Uncharacterized protein n=1 Tax=Rhizophagus irregularis (strain DAOM 181602 / DAOM 197198 / MUCL 43194) TaxID=747089 RepID=U9SSP8_RHIID